MLAQLAVVLATSAEAAQKQSGLPQLNAPDWAPQLIWLALTFGALYFILSRSTLPRIASVLDERKNRIERDLAEAERLSTETQNAIAEYEQKLSDARGQASSLAKESRDKVAADLAAKQQAAEDEAAKKMSAAEERIGAMKSEAMAQVTAISTETTQELVKTLIGADVSADDVRQALQSGN